MGGCSLAPQVSTYTIGYNGSIEEVNNQLLLANILRARDRAPLYFSDLSQIRGALTVNAGASLTDPFGQGKITTTKHYVPVVSASIATSPTFDVIPLNEQSFTQGILQPLELQYGKLYWDRVDYPEYLLAMLFVDKIEVRFYDNTGKLLPVSDMQGKPLGLTEKDGTPVTADIRVNQPDDPKMLERFNDVLSHWGVRPDNPRTKRAVSYHGYRAVTPLAPNVSLGAQGGLKDFVGLDPHKFRTVKVEETEPRDTQAPGKSARKGVLQKASAANADHYDLYSTQDRIVVCPPDSFRKAWAHYDIYIIAPQISGADIDVTPQPAAACDVSEVQTDGPMVAHTGKPQMIITVYTRSVEGMIQYLGALVRANLPKEKNPLRFFVRDGSSEDQKVSLDYAGARYSIGPYKSNDTLGDDNTLPILALVEQILNLRKNSKEITTTPAAQIVP